MIKAMVVDDEHLLAEYISDMLERYQFEVVGFFSNPCEALEKVSALRPDVLFLDIEMPELNGLELAERAHAKGYDGEIVFITAYNQYAIEAFTVNALDYLLKPVLEKDLERTVLRLRKRLRLERSLPETRLTRILNITMFGAFRVFKEDGEPIHWTTAKCAELFAFLLLQRNGEATKERLMNILFPEKNREKSDINLRSTISRLNKTLQENAIPSSVVFKGREYRLRWNTPVELHVDAFLLESLKPEADPINEESAKEYGRILAQYRGMLLENLEGEWCEPYRTEYHRRFVSLTKRLIQYSVERDAEYLPVLNLVELLTKYEPYDEAACGWAMQLHYRLTGKQGVQAYFKKYQKLLEQELGEKPEEKLFILYDQLTGNT